MLPEEFLNRMKELTGEEYPAFLAAMQDKPTRAMHANLNKITPAALVAALPFSLTPIPWAEDGFFLDSEEKVGRHPLHHAGAFYMQEPSAMAPVCCAALRPGMRVLDTCASPGGKSTQIANRIGDSGLLVSNEYVASRCATLAGNLERMGLTNAVVTGTDVPTLAARFPDYFDAVVVDAPCSGEGMFRKDPVAVSEWSPAHVRACAVRQREILNAAALTVRPGGILIYSTCTFSQEENEGVVTEFLSGHPNFSLKKLPPEMIAVTSPAVCPAGTDKDIAAAVSCSARRFYPHHGRGEGQFMACLIRAAAEVVNVPKRRKDDNGAIGAEEDAVWHDFLRDNLVAGAPLPAPVLFKGALSLLPVNLPGAADITYARGVRAGRVEKGRLIPEHWLFTAYGKYFQRQIELAPSDPRLDAYLRGETFSCTVSDGWAVVTVCGCTLGGVKVSCGVAKNHYPKGLRLRG